ncbi:hypothetical protein [Bosea sp. 117]|uniref:hypothetical protein n=1 Tax=Bosea sp. 117 TaxID=1125973 RepID=UPI00049452F2|nr:hypothetical protein [Bosea sp. 117]
MKRGDYVRVLADDWDLIGELGVVTNARPVESSSQCEVVVNGEVAFLAPEDLVVVDPGNVPMAWDDTIPIKR